MMTRLFPITNWRGIVRGGVVSALLVFSLSGSAMAQDEVAASLPADANTSCPVMPEEPADPAFYVEHEGRRIYVCCSRCKRMFNKDPQKYLKNLAPAGAPAAGDQPTTGTTSKAPQTTQSAILVIPEEPGEIAAALADVPSEPAFAARPVEPAPAPATAQDQPRETAIRPEDLSTLEKAARYSGRLHAVSVHFPIGLLLGAAAVEAAAVVRRRPIGSEGARIPLLLGALGALVAVPLGWLNAGFNQHPGLEHYVEWHRWTGTAAGLAALLSWALLRTAKSGKPMMEKAYLTSLFASACLIILSGHFGASLIYGPDYLKP